MEDFYHLAGILRLSSKYLISYLRIQAIQYLTKTWPYTIRGHDEMVNQSLTAANSVDGTTYPYVHPLHVLKLAREVDIQIIVPSALYFLSMYPLKRLHEHPKLQIDHPSRPSNELSFEDVSQYTLMYQHRINIILKFICDTCKKRKCQTPEECPQVQLASRFNIDQMRIPSMGAFRLMAQAMEWVHKDDTICGPCKRAFCEDVSVLRERLWEELPSVVGLRSWEDLLASDLPSS